MEKTNTPRGERKLIDEWSGTIETLILQKLEECGLWGKSEVEIGIWKQYPGIILEIDGKVTADYTVTEAWFNGDHYMPADPDEYTLNSFSFKGDITLFDESLQEYVLTLNTYYYDI